ncbi:hemerythrin HHE cation binding domain-containing protein [Paraburkholderia hospita]|uniref:Hemerythrin HHE cation binding domain-containing protein n=2 Tax=Paraburkholderia hospita TaxID=169430 RepID=A0ABN0FFA5_9BURK|nr:hemerythrin HHE cation binding domain-containing protein [Paraburkholderia hospita]OUL73305.1 hemerythrin [Paraburkholderia hospita]OUL81027.1 hemerythrin [Paraburkholderia hospita]
MCRFNNMSLITTLKHDHEEIFRLLDECRALGVATDEGRRKLKQVRGVVVAHLAREDHKLYPAMQKHDATRALGDMYAQEMRAMSAEIIGFFDSLDSGRAGIEFAREIGRVISHLRQRMTREEVRLYPAFEAHCE